MIRLEVFKQLTKITYILETMREDDQFISIQAIDQNHVQPGEDDQIRSIQTIDQDHAQPGEDERG